MRVRRLSLVGSVVGVILAAFLAASVLAVSHVDNVSTSAVVSGGGYYTIWSGAAVPGTRLTASVTFDGSLGTGTYQLWCGTLEEMEAGGASSLEWSSVLTAFTGGPCYLKIKVDTGSQWRASGGTVTWDDGIAPSPSASPTPTPSSSPSPSASPTPAPSYALLGNVTVDAFDGSAGAAVAQLTDSVQAVTVVLVAVGSVLAFSVGALMFGLLGRR